MLYSYVQNGWPNKTQGQLKPFHSRKNALSVDNSCLLWGSQVIIPFQLREKVLDDLHNNHPETIPSWHLPAQS